MAKEGKNNFSVSGDAFRKASEIGLGCTRRNQCQERVAHTELPESYIRHVGAISRTITFMTTSGWSSVRRVATLYTKSIEVRYIHNNWSTELTAPRS